jgi:thousand and one amino acid protein kinase
MVYFQGIDERMTKKERDESIKTQKESIQGEQQRKESGLSKQHKDIVDIEIRKFRRRRLLQFQQDEVTFLTEVNFISTAVPLGSGFFIN